MSDLIITFFDFLNNLKLYHWATFEYSRHVASGNLYDKISALMDQFVEVYQGRYGRPKVNTDLPVKTPTDKQAVTLLKNFVTFLSKDLPRHIDPKKDTELLNIRDEMLSETNQTLYLFTQH